MKTQIIGVLGLGIFGQTIATELSSFGQDVIALDIIRFRKTTLE